MSSWIRAALIPLLGLGLAAAASAAVPDRPADFDGRFSLQYVAVVCDASPCVPGSYDVWIEDELVATVAKVVVDAKTPPAVQRKFTRSMQDGLAVEGRMWVDERAGTITVIARRAAAGRWK